MQTATSQAKGRKRKFLLLLPLLTLPFLTALFWALGGGTASVGASPSSRGLNAELPRSREGSDLQGSKLSFYDLAEQDSARLRQEIVSDPYYQKEADSSVETFSYSPYPPSAPSISVNGSTPSGQGTTGTESRIYDRIRELEKVVDEPKPLSGGKKVFPQASSRHSAELHQLETMMQTIGERGGDDPELRELNAVLDKVLDVQHPGRVISRAGEGLTSKTGVGLKMSSVQEAPKTYFGRSRDTGGRSANAFYSESLPTAVPEPSNAVQAEVFQTQVISDGSTVKLRLLAPCHLGPNQITKGSFIYAVARFNRDRLQLHVPSVRYGSSVLPVSLDAYDLDGLEGIFVSLTGAKEGTERRVGQQLEAIEIGGYDASLKSRAATAGLQTAKALLLKKNKPVQIRLKAGYQILLKDKSQH